MIGGGGNPMSASQRVIRGFHRLGLFLGAIPLIVGAIATLAIVGDNREWAQYGKLVCAHEYLVRERLLLSDEQMARVKPWEVPWQMYIAPSVGETFADFAYNKGWFVRLKQIGCSVAYGDTITYGEARNLPPAFPWSSVTRGRS
jgi:hypothetical protein